MPPCVVNVNHDIDKLPLTSIYLLKRTRADSHAVTML